MRLDGAIAIIRNVLDFNDDVLRGGITSALTRSIVECKDVAVFVDALIVASRSRDQKLIFKQTTYAHYTTTQKSGRAHSVICDGVMCVPVHVLNWVVLTAPPIVFLVPYNCIGTGFVPDVRRSTAAGLAFYRELDKRIQRPRLPDPRDKILYRLLHSDDHSLHADLDTVCALATSCGAALSRHAFDDCPYGQMLESRVSQRHREALHRRIQTLIQTGDARKKIQIHIRLKLALSEIGTMNRDCQLRLITSL
jgi:hypothetical protein